jgi:chitinase
MTGTPELGRSASPAGGVTVRPSLPRTSTTPPPAPPKGLTGTSGQLIPGHVNKCVHVAYDTPTDGNRIDIQECIKSPAQTFMLASDGTIRAFGKCIDARSGTTNGTRILIYPCDGSGRQQFHYNAARRTIVNPATGRCLEVISARTNNGASLAIYDCGGGANQIWTVSGA